ncbi:MAG: SGNH/GDSL hydrolase family protein [Caulobacteraceae bacterium]
MIGLRMGLAAVLAAASTQALAAEKSATPAWVGTWGFVSAPLPPGAAQPAAIPGPPAPAPPAAIPLGPPPEPVVARPAGPPPAPPQILIENPGNVPVQALTPDLANVTVRQVVRISAGGKRLRLRLSNENGADALTLGAVHVGKAGPDGAILPGTDRVVTFAGRPNVTAPASSPLLSDPIDLQTQDLDRLAVSIYVPGQVAPRQPRTLFDYVAGTPGDQTAAAQLPEARLLRVPAYITLVEVQPDAATNVVVTLGDSITEGATSTNNAFRSWPDRLAERIAPSHWAVVNAGISGNRLLRYGAGPTALARLDRDVLSVPGVKTIILLEGINDIGRGFTPQGAREPVTLEALEAADQQIIARAHEHGIRVIGATLTPYQGATYASPEGEQARQGLNQWIKTSGAFDGVIDFAAAVADPKDPLTIAAPYNIRDHLHPNDAGYKAMGDAIDLKVVMGK